MDIRPNRAKRKLDRGETAIVVGGFTHPDDIDAFGPIAVKHGFDGIWLEGEHGWSDAPEMGNLTRACDLWGLTSVARINANHQGMIYRTLDRGAQAVVVPHVNNAHEARNVVLGGKFPPLGMRGQYTSRQGYAVPDYLERANDETLMIILIEDIVAYENLDEILAVDGVDVIFVAPGDFAASMGHMGDTAHPDVVRTMDDAMQRIVAAGRTAGAICSAANVGKYVDMGVRFLFTTTPDWLDTGAANFMAVVDSHRK